jgi:ADP-ribose pyrophosphatase YjhB (NUDIX family)
MGIYPNTFYRVSVKALVKNDEGEILVLKENQNTWSLPGGGLDHGEDPIAGLRRELEEELHMQLINIAPFCVKTFYLDVKQAWLMWVVFEATTNTRELTWGDGVTAATFINPSELKDSSDVFEELVYEITQAKSQVP